MVVRGEKSDTARERNKQISVNNDFFLLGLLALAT